MHDQAAGLNAAPDWHFAEQVTGASKGGRERAVHELQAVLCQDAASPRSIMWGII